MGIIIIFSLITIFAVWGLLRAWKRKNWLSIVFTLAAIAIFGWFSVMTIIYHGVPTMHG
ncbi:DUF2759 domain-containing protein [Metabacillus sp. GX 13764]|uniref:DUF2759 domain-containing protein n=1 Tax=Metabacillus kandeliae TaxID=2900151 RepID=UPI001E498A33|nr:DUF2759 domain-containing protein [Metabacillus kandeliae]MCD7033118.1 DUF2759 domain-containing protein [Metabacillus kandeliae]